MAFVMSVPPDVQRPKAYPDAFRGVSQQLLALTSATEAAVVNATIAQWRSGQAYGRDPLDECTPPLTQTQFLVRLGLRLDGQLA
jgi:hypothetical protein